MQTDREHADVHWYDLLLSPISARSFASIWYWIALVGFWAMQQRQVLGVPATVLAEGGERAAEDALVLARVHVRRMLNVAPVMRVAQVAGGAFAGSLVLALALAGLEMAQALLPILLPWLAVVVLRLRLAQRLAAQGPDAAALVERLLWHRLGVQALAGGAIFLAVLWGAWRNLTLAMPY
ncbi:hypothetical protein [Falsirhodobacter halotolerans]|uniref:hypothetical protein n=1 Tax=Falsirhodobacter halotolerans TaxID=1146892 RepID=UPI001FCF9CAE|nr:hypothetical protein [Falsirhodobacter halotolerans]MCJ8139670.1 hypothetical protein [Falsirhodobacter halotolerans]